MTITNLLDKIAIYIINPVIILGFVIATIFLFYGIAEMMWKSDSNDLEKNRNNVKYGIIGLFVMFSVYGILHLVLDSFGVSYPSFFP